VLEKRQVPTREDMNRLLHQLEQLMINLEDLEETKGQEPPAA
jgi:hypothetical protein